MSNNKAAANETETLQTNNQFINSEEVITSKRQISFYKECYNIFGYEVENIWKSDRNYVISFIRNAALTNDEAASFHNAKEKLRVIEIINRKKCGFNSLFLNLFIHIAVFCIQGAIFYRLHLDSAHPKTMLQIGIILFGAVLLFGFILKIIELFRWNKVQLELKQEIQQIKDQPPKKGTYNQNKIISVLFTRGHGRISELIYWCSGRQYTHASLGLGEQTDCFYSFDYRGFREEHPAHRKLKNNKKESLCYQFRVTEDEYLQLETIIKNYLEQKKTFRYNFLGAVFSVFHIYMPIKSKKVYFCSEFVSEELRRLKSFHLKKAANMYLPTNLAKTLIRQENLYKVLVDKV